MHDDEEDHTIKLPHPKNNNNNTVFCPKNKTKKQQQAKVTQ